MNNENYLQSQHIREITELDFRGFKVKVYYDKYSHENTILCPFGAKNPNAFYQGPCFLNWDTGKVEYPEGVVVPKPTKEDGEMMPKFVVVGRKTLNYDDIKTILNYLEGEHIKRNRHLYL